MIDGPRAEMRDEASCALSVTDVFTIGIGPSSSHTVGPMRAARMFAATALRAGRGEPVRVSCRLYGSLALTGRGHGTDIAVILGLAGAAPETIDPSTMSARVSEIRDTRRLQLCDEAAIPFDEARDLVLDPRFLERHPNGMDFIAEFADGVFLAERYFSLGGGVIALDGAEPVSGPIAVRYPFRSAEELLAMCDVERISIAELMRTNESSWQTDAEADAFIDRVASEMFATIDRGCTAEGVLPGGLDVQRRARSIHERLTRGNNASPSVIFEWVSLYALAVSEENAAGGRVVTAPTNGAAGVIPAVLKYYKMFVPGADWHGIRVFLYTAAAIGALYKGRASISAAEMGCQGEVGVACSMAAAGLAAALGGSNRQIENAAEIGMEHNLGLTCDPVRGLVQIPCIERNTMGAVKAINACHLAVHGNGQHVISLDQVIETMRQTGHDMASKYKETSTGGLALNFSEC